MFHNNLELIIGPVCSGKSAELIRKINRYQITGFNVLMVKPKVDSRSSLIKSRNGSQVSCYEMEWPEEIYRIIVEHESNGDNINKVSVIALDEAQFYEKSYDVVKDLLLKGYKVIVSALDSDFRGEPFKEIIRMVNISDSVNKLTAVCMECKNDNAIFSQKLKKGGNQIEIGDLELYHPRCLNCFIPGGIG